MVEVKEKVEAEVRVEAEPYVVEISALDERGEPKPYKLLNDEVHRAAAAGPEVIRVSDVHGQRFLPRGWRATYDSRYTARPATTSAYSWTARL